MRRCARKRVARLLRAAGLVGCHRRRRARTTTADPAHTPAPNLVARDCAASEPDRLWLGASTYLPTGEGWLSLAVLLDAHARRVVGWAMADHAARRTGARRAGRWPSARAAPAQAWRTTPTGAARIPPPPTGRASPRTTAPARCAGRARASTTPWRSAASRPARPSASTRARGQRAAARLALFAWVEVWYNRQRAHSALGYRAPVAHEEQQLLLLQDLAA